MADLKRCALQLVTLNMEEKKVEVNEEALAVIEENLAKLGAKRIAIVSVMGAYRGGKSFFLDLCLRKLRYERNASGTASDGGAQPSQERGANHPCEMPAWLTAAGKVIEGGVDHPVDEAAEGFRFKGGMDHCTEGIWVWSEPFMRKIDGEDVALLLMDTQGAWDGRMTREQSATIFGLTALVSSKQIYNVRQQIQEDYVENLAYFMRFAQAALRQIPTSSKGDADRADIDTPFQSLDFLVRDWSNFEEDWSVLRCKEMMEEHLDRHLNPTRVVENSTAQALHTMFARIKCFCLPHPGLKITKAAWSGSIDDIEKDFLLFLDIYVHDVFSSGLKVKTLFGRPLTATTFPHIFKTFVKAFGDAAPVAMSFNQAMTKATVLLAKEQALESYNKKMEDEVKKHPQGIKKEEFQDLHRSFSTLIEQEYSKTTILGSDETRDQAWESIRNSLDTMFAKYDEDNERRLEKALVAFGNYALIALVLFLLDRVSDWTCDWWSKTCQDASRVMLLVYSVITCYVGWHIYQLNTERGRVATGMAAAELWKEMLRLCNVYLDFAKQAKWDDLAHLAKKTVAHVQHLVERRKSQEKGKPVTKEGKKSK